MRGDSALGVEGIRRSVPIGVGRTSLPCPGRKREKEGKPDQQRLPQLAPCLKNEPHPLLPAMGLTEYFLSPDHGLRKAKKPKKKTKKRRHKSVRREGTATQGPAMLRELFSRLPGYPSQELSRRALGSYRTVLRARQTLRRKLARRVMRKNQNRTRTGSCGGQNSLTAPQVLESRRRR